MWKDLGEPIPLRCIFVVSVSVCKGVLKFMCIQFNALRTGVQVITS